MTDLEVEPIHRRASRQQPRRRPTKHLLLGMSAVSLPLILILTGLVLVFANLPGDSTPDARPALSQARPGTSTSVPNTAPSTPPDPIPSAAPSVDPQRRAVDLAQQLATELSRHDFVAARAISQFAQTDAALALQYQSVIKQVVVPVDIVPTGPSQFQLRLLLVSNQSSQNLTTTVFYCARWTVDSAAGTILQGNADQLKTGPGLLTADEFPELVPACHRAPLP